MPTYKQARFLRRALAPRDPVLEVTALGGDEFPREAEFAINRGQAVFQPHRFRAK